MKKIIILLALFVAMPAIAALIDFDRVTQYTDNTAIPAAKVPTIQYQGYSGPSLTGPWTAAGLVTDNLAISAPDPAPGATLWYTADAYLDGQTSEKAAAVSITTPFLIPSPPRQLDVR